MPRFFCAARAVSSLLLCARRVLPGRLRKGMPEEEMVDILGTPTEAARSLPRRRTLPGGRTVHLHESFSSTPSFRNGSCWIYHRVCVITW